MRPARPQRIPAARPGRERGAVLALALVILLILTIIGVTALLTTAFEGKMAGGVQELNRAFRAAEAGLEKAYATSKYTTTSTPVTGSVTSSDLGGVSVSAGATATYSTEFKGYTNPPVQRIQNASSAGARISAARYDTTSIGRSVTSAEVELHQGSYQLMPRP